MDKGVVAFAKMIVDNGGANPLGMHRQDFENEIIKRAERRDGESSQQAFTRFITETETGRVLFKAAMLAPPRQAPQDLPVPERPEPAGEASAELERLAQFEAKAKNVSFQQAYTRLLTSPEHRELVRRVKHEELTATRMVADSRWPLREAERASETREWVDSLNQVGRRRFRPDSL
jgi:hypothetical protein